MIKRFDDFTRTSDIGAKKGDSFVVKQDTVRHGFNRGSIVVLYDTYRDSVTAKFEQGGRTKYIPWDNLGPVEQTKKKGKKK